MSRGECYYCGTTSPRYSTSEEARRWLDEHRGKCAGTTTTKTPAPVDWKAVDELVARARRFKPIDTGVRSSSALAGRVEPKRVDVDAWGRSSGGGVRWVGVNCLRSALSNLIGVADFRQVPDPEPFFDSEDWLAGYNAELAKRFGVRLVRQPAHVCMDIRNQGKWIAAIHEPNDDADHVLVARGSHVAFDPGGFYRTIPAAQLMYGFMLTRASRAVPVVSARALVAG